MKHNFYAKASPQDLLSQNFLFHKENSFAGKEISEQKGETVPTYDKC